MTLGEPMSRTPGVPVGGISGSLPMAISRAMATASAASWAAVMAAARLSAALIAGSSSASASSASATIEVACAAIPATMPTWFATSRPFSAASAALLTALPIFANTEALLTTFAAISASRSSGGTGVQCIVMSMKARAARVPPMKTLDEPVKISNIGGSPQQVGLMPMSPHRAAGSLLMSTWTHVPSKTGPKGGSGIGGKGGGPLGGCR